MSGGRSMDRRGFLRGLGIAMLAAPSVGASELGPVGPPPLALVSSNSVPLKSSIDAHGRPGFAVDIASAVARAAGFRPEAALLPWERALYLGRERKALVMAMFKTPERLDQFDFTDAVFEDEVVVVTRRGQEFRLDDPEDLIGRRCAVQQGAQYGARYAAVLPELEVETDNNPGQRLKKLLYRNVDCALFNPGACSVMHTIRANGLSPADFAILPRPLARVPSFMAIGKHRDNAPLIKRLDAGIATLTKTGVIARIMDGYLTTA